VTQHPERAPDEVVILVRENGPFRVYGPARLVDVNGKEYEIAPGEWFSLCRCGHSARKPFCDSTHKSIDFVGPSSADEVVWE
jgi:CDGSH iron-sulfur domain-containing protein 3